MAKSLQLFSLFVFLYIASGTLSAQSVPVCSNSSQLAADFCADACYGCQINGYQGSTSGFTSEGNSFCSGLIAESNSVWHGFIAGTSPMTIGVSNTNCMQGDGLQIAVFTGCGGTEIACDPGTSGGASSSRSVTFAAVIGEVYLLMVNGNNGDICNYQITANGAQLLPPPIGTGPINGLSQVCPGALTHYSVSPFSNVFDYEWRAPAGASINESGQNVLVVPSPGGQVVNITFGNTPGTGQVTVKGLGGCGAATSTIAKTVQVVAIPPNTLPTLTLYPEDLPYYWEIEPFTPVTNTGTYQLTSVLTSWLGCDSIVRQTVIAQPRPSGRVFWDLNGNNVYNAGTDIPVEGQNMVTSTGQMSVTDEEGMYLLNSLPAGAQINLNGLPNFTATVNPASHIFQTGVYNIYHFALRPQRGPASGRVYIDNDQNGAFNAGDTPVNNVAVNSVLGAQTVTDVNGNFQFTDMPYLDRIAITAPQDLELASAGELEFIPTVNTGYDFRLRQKSAFGKVWWDIDQSNTISPGDIPAANISLTSASGSTALTNSTGVFYFSGLMAGDTIRVTSPGVPVLPGFQVTDAVAPPGGYAFLLIPTSSAPDLSIDMTNLTVFRPGFNTKVIITVKNEQPVYVPNTAVAFHFPGIPVSFLSALPAPGYVGTDSLHWSLGGLLPYETRQLQVVLRTQPGTALNAVLNFFGWVYPVAGDIYPPNNADMLITQVLGSYDPNDKQVDPEYITPAMLSNAPPFEYTIRFQNTGNYPADHVIITDTLSQLLDWNTVRLLSSSHPCTWTVGATGVLKVQFPNIMLLDSVNNEPASHGFVKFSANPQPGLSLGLSVENNCDIFFDFNPPIRTNTVKTQVVYFLPGTSIPPGNKVLSARPNPASFRITFSWPDLTVAEGLITLYNMSGIAATSVVIPQGVNIVQVNTAFLPDGLYQAVFEAGGLFYTKRVAVLKDGSIRRE